MLIKYVAVIILLTVILSLMIISGIESNHNTDIKYICKYPQFESCENLEIAKDYCEPAQEYFEKFNCSVTNNKWGWFDK